MICTPIMAMRPTISPALIVVPKKARQSVVDNQRAGLRNRRRRVEKNQLYQDIGKRGSEEGHHQGGDNFIHALIGPQSLLQKRPYRSNSRRQRRAEDECHGNRQITHQNRCCRCGYHRAQEKLAIDTEIPDASTERYNQSGVTSSSGPMRVTDCSSPSGDRRPLDYHLIVIQWIDAEQEQQSAGNQQSEDNRRKRGEHDLK